MFLLKVSLRSEAGQAGDGVDASSLRVERDGTRVEAHAGPLYGFACASGDYVTVGESTAPLAGEELSGLRAAVAAAVPLETLAHEPFLLLAVVDLAAKRVVLAHSIAANRPYYYAATPGRFVISTSLRALREVGVPIAWDPDATPEFLAYRVVAPPRSIVRGVRKMIGGQTVTIDLSTGAVTADRRWKYPPPASPDAAAAVEQTLAARVDESMRRFPNAGALLSGGLDSSLLTALAIRSSPRLPTYSANFSFADPEDREEEYARSMARELSVPHDVIRGTPEDYLAGWVESLEAAEEPVHHLQSVMLHLLFRDRAKAGLGALLCGEGADRLFGNDAHFFLHRHRLSLAILRATHLGVLVAPLGRAFGVTGRLLSRLATDYGADAGSSRHLLWTLSRYGDRTLIRRLLACGEQDLLGERRTLVEPYRDRPLMDQVTILSLLTDGHATIGIWGKLAEAAGMHLVCPFTCPSVVDAVTSVPWDVKLREEKHLVRAALRRAGVAETFLSRPKRSFGFSTKYWAPKGMLFQPVVDMAAEAVGRETLEPLQQDEGGSSMVLWGLLNQYLWRQLFESARPPADLIGEILDRRRTQGVST